MGDGCDESCRFKCSNKISFEDRNEAFRQFWNLGDRNLQRICISQWVKTMKIKRKEDYENDNSIREKQNSHHFSLPKMNGEFVKVCKKMFLQTLGKLYIYIEFYENYSKS